MRPIRVVPIGGAEQRLVDAAIAALAAEYRTRCVRDDALIDPAFAWQPERGQYHSTRLVERLAERNGGPEIVVGIASVDLYIPILTFVFGEAQLGGSCAVVSYHRFHQELYGLPADPALLITRLQKTAIHEVGHTEGLTHCDDYECVMAASHSVEWLDLKGMRVCAECRGKL